MLRRLCALVVGALAIFAPTPVRSHGYLVQPPSRNYLAYKAGLDYDVMSLNGGGPWSVWPSGNWQPGGGGNHPICGREQYSAPGASTATWQAGQDVQLSVVITAPHAGLFYFGLCSVGRESPDCFARHKLLNTEDGTDYFNLKNRGGSFYGAAGTYTMTFRLPADAPTGLCTLQWYYLTANSCDPPGMADPPTGMGVCGGSAIPGGSQLLAVR